MHRLVWFAALALSAAASPAAAIFFDPICQTGCAVPGGQVFLVDFTLPADGLAYRWDITTNHPDATVSLSFPNEIFTVERIGDGLGGASTPLEMGATPFTWVAHEQPGHSSYTFSVAKDFDHCGPTTALNEVCAATYNVWGNADGLFVNTDQPVRFTFTQTLLPEPESWALAVVGLGGAGAMLRRRRRTVWAA